MIKKFNIKPYVNYMKEDDFPFLSANWGKIGSSFKMGMKLETVCDFKNIESYLEHIKNQVQQGNLSNSRREFVMVGRSNVGKSSLINSLVEAQVALTSNYPGKTRKLFFFNSTKFNEVFLVDAPGYGFARGDKKELEQWGKMMIKYFTQSSFLHRVICLIDSEHGIKEVDTMLYDILENKTKPFIIVFTKCDKINEKRLKELFLEAKNVFKNYNMSSPIIHATSERMGWGIQELRSNIAFLLKMDLLLKPNQKI